MPPPGNWRQARSELEPFSQRTAGKFALIGDLAADQYESGDKASAFKLIEREMAAVPIEKDALDGPAPTRFSPGVAARMGEPDRAIAALQKLLLGPVRGPLGGGQVSLTSALLRLDPMFRSAPERSALSEN